MNRTDIWKVFTFLLNRMQHRDFTLRENSLPMSYKKENSPGSLLSKDIALLLSTL